MEKAEVISFNNTGSDSVEADIKIACQTIDREIEALKVMEKSLDSTLTKALNILQNTKGRVIVTGMGKSGH
ncbi:MAG: hypothetical protein IKO06_04870, partial [Alphaproteobacteria bacterium]|nr:hypothetical protein [Alphaproteobacteria bacterium]